MSIKLPKVSIIISATKNINYLWESINSIKQQTFTNFEILICHQHNSPNLVKWFEHQKDPRLRLFVEEDLDRVQMLNLILKGARGKYIAFIQPGDLWHPNKLAKQVLYLDRYPRIGLLHSWMTLIDEQSKPLGKILKHQLSGWVKSEIVKRNQIGYSSVMMRWDCFEKVGLFDPSLQTSYDWDLWIRLSHSYELRVIPEPLVYYRRHQNEIEEIWLTEEQDFQAIIEKAYKNAPSELLTIKNSSYSYASLNLAWSVLENRNPDTAIANHYCRQALEHYPQIGFSREFFQLSLAVLTLHCLKSDRFLSLFAFIQTIRNWLQIAISKLKLSAHLFWNWMLEEEEIRGDDRRIRDEG